MTTCQAPRVTAMTPTLKPRESRRREGAPHRRDGRSLPGAEPSQADAGLFRALVEAASRWNE